MVISGTRLRTDGIKAISRGISGCNQNIKFANARNRGQHGQRSYVHVPLQIQAFWRKRKKLKFLLT